MTTLYGRDAASFMFDQFLHAEGELKIEVAVGWFPDGPHAHKKHVKFTIRGVADNAAMTINGWREFATMLVDVVGPDPVPQIVKSLRGVLLDAAEIAEGMSRHGRH